MREIGINPSKGRISTKRGNAESVVSLNISNTRTFIQIPTILRAPFFYNQQIIIPIPPNPATHNDNQNSSRRQLAASDT